MFSRLTAVLVATGGISLLVGCKRNHEPTVAQPSLTAPSQATGSATPIGPAPPMVVESAPVNWLELTATIHSQERAGFHPVTDLRDAIYFNGRVLLLVHDELESDSTKPDPTRLVLIGGSQRADPLPLSEAVLPGRLFPAPARDWAACQCFSVATPSSEGAAESVGPQLPGIGPQRGASDSGSKPNSPQLALIRPTAEAEGIGPSSPSSLPKVTLVDTNGLAPTLVGNDNLIYFRRAGSVAVADGLFSLRPDWTKPVSMAKTSTPGTLLEVKDPAILASPDGTAAVGLLPAGTGEAGGQWSLYCWEKSSGLESRVQTALPASTAAAPDDAASVGWIGTNHIAVCYPASAGQAATNWMLVSFETADAKPTLIADRLPPQMEVKTTGEYVFYCTPDEVQAGSWSLWASSPDGLNKRKLYTAAGASMSVLDAAAQGLLLLVQSEAGDGTLLELALSPLPPWSVPAETSSIEPPAQPVTSGPVGPSKPEAESTEGSAEDPGSRYRRRDQGPQRPPGVQPQPPPDSGGSAPPDLTLPGL